MLNSSDGDLLVKLLRNVIQTEGKHIEVDEFSFSSLDLIIGLQKLSNSSEDNLQLLTSKPILPVLSAALESEQPQEKLAVCLLLWNFLSMSKTRESNPEIPCLTEQLKVLACSSDPQLKNVSECILMVLKEQGVEGELLSCHSYKLRKKKGFLGKTFSTLGLGWRLFFN